MTTRHFRFLTDQDIEALPRMEWLVDQILPTGSFGVLYGPTEVGKSFVALDIAAAVALGQTWCDRRVRGGRVVYIAVEGKFGLQGRLAALKARYGVTSIPRILFLTDPVYLHMSKVVTDYLADLQTLTADPIALTIVDTLSRCSTGSEENSNADRELTNQGIAEICRATRGSVLVIHHTGWKTERMRGGTALPAAADTVLALRKVQNRKFGVELKVEKQRDGARGAIVPLTLCKCLDSLVVTSAVVPSATLTEQQFRALRTLEEISRSEGVSATTWENATDMPQSTFYSARTRLIADGLVQHSASGRYSVASPGFDLLQLQPNSNELHTGVCTTLLHPPP